MVSNICSYPTLLAKNHSIDVLRRKLKMVSVDAETRRSGNLVCDLVYTVMVHRDWLMVNKFLC